MKDTLKAWLRFFRAVNLPTVPGDILAGAALWPCFAGCAPVWRHVAAAAAASVFLYMFGLADNDIVGAKTDRGRPIPDGEISLGAARSARSACLFAAMGIALVADIPGLWWSAAFALLVAIVLYNRTKWSALMGLCRALNLVCGVAGAGNIFSMDAALLAEPVIVAAAVWLIYIWGVTKYSEGEEADPARKRRVGVLIGALVWLQLAVTLIPAVWLRCLPFAIAQLAMIALLFLFKRLMPKVSAS